MEGNMVQCEGPQLDERCGATDCQAHFIPQLDRSHNTERIDFASRLSDMEISIILGHTGEFESGLAAQPLDLPHLPDLLEPQDSLPPRHSGFAPASAAAAAAQAFVPFVAGAEPARW